MRVLTAHTMQELDKRTIEEFGIPGLTLMENAGRGCVEAIAATFGAEGNKRAVIIAGKGNNGGDGYVIARLLAETGWSVKVHVLAEPGQITGDAAANLARLPADMVSFCPHEGELAALHQDDIHQADLIIDAMLGTGLRNEVTGVFRDAIEMINRSGRPILAVDIPSGIHGTTGRVLGDAVRADITVTFAFAKLGHVLYPGAEHTGRLLVVEIGIPPQLAVTAPGYDFLTPEHIRPLVRRRDRQAHKGHFGHCLVVAGSPGKTGAATLSTNSAVRSGSGLVTLAVPASLHQILEIKTTEAMTVALPDGGSGHLTGDALPDIEKLLPGKDVLALGPGIDRRSETVALVRTLLETVDLPMVLDADALNALAEDITILQRKKSATVVLTPHPGEMARLLGTSIPDVETIRISLAQEFARNNGVYLVLKGARTVIATPQGTAAINGSGNPGMATGGMGDVLTGVIASLLGQGYSAENACRLGVFIHGYAADLVAADKGEIGISAGDVQEKLPYAFNKVLNTPAAPTGPCLV